MELVLGCRRFSGHVTDYRGLDGQTLVVPFFLVAESVSIYLSVLYCTVLYGTVRYCTVLYCTIIILYICLVCSPDCSTLFVLVQYPIAGSSCMS